MNWYRLIRGSVLIAAMVLIDTGNPNWMLCLGGTLVVVYSWGWER